MLEPYVPVARRGLVEIVALRVQLDRLERDLVLLARRQGASWRELGEDLGISLQSAWSRHASADPVRRPRRPHWDPWLRDEPPDDTPPFPAVASTPPEGSDPFRRS